MRIVLSKLLHCRRGATAVEYGLIVSLIVIAMLASLQLVANQNTAIWGNVNNAVANAR